MAVTPARAATFLATLRKTGSLSAAAAAASPHLMAKEKTRGGIASFREYARRNPDFAADVEAALTAIKGEMEALVFERARTPDEKPLFNPKTGELHYAVDHRNANDMLKLWLASHDPTKWAPKQSIRTDATVTHVGGGSLLGGAQWVIRPDDILLLDDPADQRHLIDLLSKIEDSRASATPPPPPLTRSYKGWGEGERQDALPGPEDATDAT